jgi:ketosteroid isomerase-like protein
VEQWIESFDGLHADVEEYIDVGDDRVFTWSRFTGRGRTSGVPADWHLAIIFTIRGGKVVCGEEYFDRAEALEAAGLRE